MANVEIKLNINGELIYKGSESEIYKAKLKAEGFFDGKAGNGYFY
jgi:hypothetical protein